MTYFLKFKWNNLDGVFSFKNFYGEVLEDVIDLLSELLSLHLPELEVSVFIVPYDA